MRFAFLIALREYVENAKTKGFWIGIFMFPAIIGIAIVVTALLARADPARHFIVVDQSGAFAEAIELAVEREHQQSVLQALNGYAQRNISAENRARPDLSAVPANGVDTGERAVDRFVEAGGKEGFLERIRPRLDDDAPEFVEPSREFVRLDLPSGIDADASIEEIARQLRPYLNGERSVASGGETVQPFAAVLIGPDALDEAAGSGRAAGAPAIQYWSSNLTDGELPGLIRTALNDEVRRRLYMARGVDAASVREIEQTAVGMSAFDPGKEEGRETVSVADRIVRSAPLAFVYLLWISIFAVMQMLLNNTIEEKSNRIIEVLLSSASPGELMMGKLLGIAAIGFTMVAAWLLTAFAALQLYQGAGAEVLGQALAVLSSSGLVPTFLVCFLFGYLLYAGLFLSAGSLCNDLKEAQNLQGPMMMIMLVPLLTMVFINEDPNGALATVMTWIPLYTPFLVMNRAAADPPLLELVGATLLMIATALVVLWLSGRIFRMGILRTGQRPRFVELVQWMRGTAET